MHRPQQGCGVRALRLRACARFFLAGRAWPKASKLHSTVSIGNVQFHTCTQGPGRRSSCSGFFWFGLVDRRAALPKKLWSSYTKPGKFYEDQDQEEAVGGRATTQFPLSHYLEGLRDVPSMLSVFSSRGRQGVGVGNLLKLGAVSGRGITCS